MRISDWSSDVCSSDLDQLACVVELPCMVDAREASCIAGLFTDDLRAAMGAGIEEAAHHPGGVPGEHEVLAGNPARNKVTRLIYFGQVAYIQPGAVENALFFRGEDLRIDIGASMHLETEEHTSELQSLMRTSYA